MKQHNTFTLKDFIIRAVIAYCVTLIIFCLFIFKVIPGCSLLQSKLVLFLLTVLSFGLIYFEKDERRNYNSLLEKSQLVIGLASLLSLVIVLSFTL